MKRIFTLVFSLVFLGANAQNMWTEKSISNFKSATEEEKFTLPTKFNSYALEIAKMESMIEKAPSEEEWRNGEEGLIIGMPQDNGEVEEFEFWYSPVMQAGLASKYPSIRSYKGVSTTHKSKNIRVDIGPNGLHAAIHSPDKVVYIDPYARGNKLEYLVYNVEHHGAELEVPFCGVEDHLKGIHFDDVLSVKKSQNNIPMREYKFALACTGEWGGRRGTVELALADMVTSTNRINQVFENDLAIRLVLVDDNDKLIHLDGAVDPYQVTNSGGAMLGVNTAIINQLIDFSSYDVGHVYHNACDVGGIAALGSMCNNGNKAAGVTCHYSNNLDFMSSIVATHELGHQMTAQHSFNNCDSQNESLGNGYEPGSGSTIMSYSGLCGPDRNVQGTADDYFHVASLIQIYNHTRDGGSADACADIIETNNQEPVINIEIEDLSVIPEDTYFFLEGTATDANDDELTYSWEGFNAGPLSPLGSPIGSAPRFRALPPTSKAVRYFPSADNILNGQFDRTEVLPDGEMMLNFMFVVRDNNVESGTAVWEEVRLQARGTEGKFEVTSQNTNTIVQNARDLMEVTWNVAGTDEAPFNVEFVDVLLNTETSTNFDVNNMEVLATKVPNNGAAKVYVPNAETIRGRIIVRAHGKNYFTINQRNIRVTPASEPTVFFTPDQYAVNACLPTETNIELFSEGFEGLTGDMRYEIVGELPEGVETSFLSNNNAIGESNMLTINYGDQVSGSFEMEVKAIVDGVDEFTRIIPIHTFNSDHSAIAALGPIDGEPSASVAPTFEWNPSPNALEYTLEVATSPTFGATTIFSETSITDNDFDSPVVLDKSTAYYWRVIPSNECEAGEPFVFAFSTAALECAEFSPNENDLPINISQSGVPVIEAGIDVQGGSIADVNISSLVGEHDNNKDLVATLISPAGTRARLFNKICNQRDFNVAFDQSSNGPVRCPLNANGTTYRPLDNFDVFNGETASGRWILEISDTAPGNGGRLETVNLEICASKSVLNPYVEINNKLEMSWDGERVINAGQHLQVGDDDNPNSDLIFTIVELPTEGQLILEGNPAQVGDQYSQEDIFSSRLRYRSSSFDYETFFSFTVIDGNGGFLGITNFDIDVKQITSTIDPNASEEIELYPNPTTDVLNVDLAGSANDYNSYQIFALDGKVMTNALINGRTTLNVNVRDYSTGVYIIVLKNETTSVRRRFIVE